MNYELNVIGLRCPEPLMVVRKKMRELSSNDILCIVADDPSTERDFNLLCTHMNYKLLETDLSNPQALSYKIQKP